MTENSAKEIPREVDRYASGEQASNFYDVFSGLTPGEVQLLRDVASRAINGDFLKEEIRSLAPGLSERLPKIVNYLLALRANPALRAIQEKNPYFSAYVSPIIRDRKRPSRNER
jgi:hypothetical protein